MLDDQQTNNALTVLTRLAHRKPETTNLLVSALELDLMRQAVSAIEVAQQTGDPIGKVLASLLSVRPDVAHSLAEVESEIPKRTVALRETAELLAAGRVDNYR
jgi:hypothetical protein